jgi:PAS domain S-box-containing protein
MSKYIIKRIVSLVCMIAFIWGQNASSTTNGLSWLHSVGMVTTTFILLFIVAIYAIYLYYLKQKLSGERDQLTKLSIDLKSEVVKKDSQFKEKSLALQIIEENTFDAIIILNNIGRIIFWNLAAEQLFGYSSEEVIDSDLIDVIIPKDKVSEFTEKYKPDRTKQLSTTKKILHITAIRKDGTQFPAELAISDLRHDDTWNTVGIIRNISDRKTLEQELMLSENRLKLTLQGEEEYLWDWNIQTNEMYFSPTVQSLLGFEKKELRRKYQDWLKYIYADDRPKVEYELEKHITGKINMVRVEYRMKSAYGNWNWIYTRGKIVEYDDEKKPLRFIGTNMDINEQKQYELDVQKLQEQLIQEKEK